jgi:hypothetical protein
MFSRLGLALIVTLTLAIGTADPLIPVAMAATHWDVQVGRSRGSHHRPLVLAVRIGYFHHRPVQIADVKRAGIADPIELVVVQKIRARRQPAEGLTSPASSTRRWLSHRRCFVEPRERSAGSRPSVRKRSDDWRELKAVARRHMGRVGLVADGIHSRRTLSR